MDVVHTGDWHLPASDMFGLKTAASDRIEAKEVERMESTFVG